MKNSGNTMMKWIKILMEFVGKVPDKVIDLSSICHGNRVNNEETLKINIYLLPQPRREW